MTNLARLFALALLASAGTASAQGFDGAVFSFGRDDNDDSYHADTLAGDVEFGLGGGWSVQLGFHRLDYGPGPGGNDADALIAHVVYDVSDTASLGVFYSSEDFVFSGEWVTAGVEAQFTLPGTSAGDTELEITLAHASDSFDEVDLLSAEAFVPIASGFSAHGKLVIADGDYDGLVGTIGLRYDHTSGGFAQLDYSSGDGIDDYEVIGLELGWTFGGGTTFGGRTWNDYFPAF